MRCGMSATIGPTGASWWPTIRPSTCARLFLGDAIGQIIRNGLAIMGVEAVEEMK